MGLFLQNTANALPPKAMKTTLTADGIATRGSAKCFCASKKPRAALCIPAEENLLGADHMIFLAVTKEQLHYTSRILNTISGI